VLETLLTTSAEWAGIAIIHWTGDAFSVISFRTAVILWP